MDILIKTTFLIILVFSVINFIAFGIISANSKKSLYFRFVLFWGTLILNFFIQGLAQETENFIVAGYAFSLLPLNMLAYSSIYFTGLKYPIQKFLLISAGGLASSAVFVAMNLSFTLKALPLSLATAAPMVYIAYLYLWKVPEQTTALMRVHAGVLIVMAIHCLNFALFRMDPNAQLWGWPVSYAIYQLLAALIPAMSLDFYHRQEQNRLEGIIEARTQQLNATNVTLQTALMEKTYLFRTLVHDVSNPLTVALAYLEKGKDADLPQATRLKVLGMAKRIGNLISQVRDFDKVRSGSDSIEVETIPLNQALRDLMEMFESKLRLKNIKINTNIEDFPDLSIRSGKHMLENSILPNILNNAIKFSHPGSVIDIEIKPQGDRCSIEIKDYGDGIPSEILGCVFDFEAKTNRPGTEAEPGSGFGLPITKMMIERCQGEVSIDSNIKTDKQPGSTLVKLTFPLAESSRGQTALAA